MPCTWSLDNTGDTVFKCAHNNEFGESRLSYTQDRLEFGSIRYVPVKEVRILTKFTFHSQLTASSPGWNENFGWSPSLLVPQAPPKDEEHPCSHHAFLPEQEGLHHCDYWRGKKRDAMMNRHKIKQNIVFYSSLLANYTLMVVNPTSKFSHPKVWGTYLPDTGSPECQTHQMSIFSPFDTKNWMVSTCPHICKAVLPWISVAKRSAPNLWRRRHMSTFPLAAARCMPVRPRQSRVLGSKPHSNRRLQ